jgi:ketosteroid isomerase-like protein
MYHTIVKNIVKKNFERVNQHDYDTLLQDCVPNVKHRFGGNHALGGERNDVQTLRRWFERLGKVLPQLCLTVTDIWVKGWPQHTTIFVRWRASMTLANGEPYENRGVHIIVMKWGKVHSLDVHEDSEAVAKALRKQAEAGIAEALAPKLES